MIPWRRGWQSWLPELIGAGLGLLLLGGLWLQRHPVLLGAAVREATPEPLQSQPLASDVLLLLSPGEIARQAAAPLATRGWSAWWINLLEQEVGPFVLLRTDEATPADLLTARVVVVADGAWEELAPSVQAGLQQLLAQGGVVLAERPLGGRLQGPNLLELPRSPLPELVQQQQGTFVPPSQAARRGVPPGQIQTTDLALPGPACPREPFADRQERLLWAQVGQRLLLPAWWPFPRAAAGVVALTYDEEGFGDRSAWMAEQTAAAGLGATFFVLPAGGLTPAGARRLVALGGDLQVHWNRGFFGQRTDVPLGLGPFIFARSELSLAEQRAAVEELLPPPRRIWLNRNHGLLWDAPWATSFRQLAAAGLLADSTYGPAGPGRCGYLFGTGLPFRPLDRSGFPFALYEVPFLFQDDEEYTAAFQLELLQRSQAGDHQLLTVIYHTNTMARVPAADRIQRWLDLPAQARATEHLVLDLGTFLRFYWARNQSRLLSSFREGVLQVDAEAVAAGLTLRLPEVAPDGTRPVALRLDGQPVPLATTVRRAGSLLLPLERGRHAVTVSYR